MTINAADLTQYVIKPTLDYLDMYSNAAEKLLLGTAAQESDFDPFCDQHDGFGIYQITSQQHQDIWDSYLAFNPDLASKVRGLASQHEFLKNPDQELRINLAYSTAIAWIIYLRSDIELPAADDLEALGECWEDNFCHAHYHNDNHHCHSQDFALWMRQQSAA